MTVGPSSIGQLANQESLLLDYLHRLEDHKRGREAVHIHLSRLLPRNRRDHHVRIAAHSFESLVKSRRGQLFVLGNSDLFVVFKAEAINEVETSILKLRFMFGEDPLLLEDDEYETRFFTHYDVQIEYDDILQVVRSLVHEIRDSRSQTARSESKSPIKVKQMRGEPLTPRVLGRIEQALQRADISNMVRRQSVCALIGDATPQPLFGEVFISIRDLRETLLPGVDLSSNRWLFQHLTETLDRRMLSMLARSQDQAFTGNISVNLNVSTLLSPEFMEFDDGVTASMRGSMVVELQNIDIFADFNAFLFARDFAKDRGYRICIDGLTEETMAYVNREKLGADLIKLIWKPGLSKEVQERIRAMVVGAGTSRVILCRCDDGDAVEFGQDAGIKMFQGRHIEELVAEEMRRRELETVQTRLLSSDSIE
jgi:hypothetical protein